MKRFLSWMLLLALLTAGFAFAQNKADDLIYDQVRVKMANDRETGGGNIDVKVTDGVVELSGSVKNERQKQKAEKIAKKVKGVKSVENKLRVSPL